MPTGRPSTYDQAKTIDAMETAFQHGRGIAHVASTLNVSKDTVYRWIREDDALSDAFERCKAMSQKWWEENVIDCAMEGKGNAALLKMFMYNKFPEEYRERQEVSIDGSIGLHEIVFTGYDENTDDSPEDY